MMVLVSYDVSLRDDQEARRLRRIARVCTNYGQRVQFSVFECLVDPAQWTNLKAQLIREMDEEKDSLRFYFLGSNWKKRVEHIGAKAGIDQQGPLVL